MQKSQTKTLAAVVSAGLSIGPVSLSELGLNYAIRIQPDVHVKCRRYAGSLSDWPVKRGLSLLL